jgi:hypothetical protein
VEIPPLVLPKITLTGITTILSSKRALLKVQAPAKPRKPPRMDSYILAEGQSGGPIQVLQINERESIVKLKVSNTVISVTFEKEQASPASALSIAPRAPLAWPRPGIGFKSASR